MSTHINKYLMEPLGFALCNVRPAPSINGSTYISFQTIDNRMIFASFVNGALMYSSVSEKAFFWFTYTYLLGSLIDVHLIYNLTWSHCL